MDFNQRMFTMRPGLEEIREGVRAITLGQQFRGSTEQPHFGGKLAIQTHNRYPSTYSVAI